MNSDELITSVKRRASIPEAQSTFQDTDFLELATEEQNIGLVPSILSMHEEYYVQEELVALTTGTLRYPIPYRAIGNKLRDLTYVDTQGNEYPTIKVSQEDSLVTFAFDTNPLRYKVQAGNIVILASSTSPLVGSLKFYYFLRPNALVLLERGAQITAIDTGTGVITFDEVPEHFTTSLLYDFNRTKSDHRIITFDVAATAVTGTTVTFAVADIPSDLEVGDYICQAGETVIPNVPTDLHVVLAHRVATRCLEALGATQDLQNANVKLQEMEIKTGTLIDNRVESAPTKVINRNSFLKRQMWRK
jgi:hypothetical protein